MLNVSEITARILELRKEANKLYQKAVEGAFKEFFDKYPQCQTIYWRQYTPHFNDGDPCEFSVHNINFSPKAPDELEEYEGADDFSTSTGWDKIPNPEYGKTRWALKFKYVSNNKYDERTTPEMREDMEIIRGLANSAEDAFAAAYGDGVVVWLTREGAKVEAYDHD